MTIEAKAREFADKIQPGAYKTGEPMYTESDAHEKIMDAYLAGYNEAAKWISVDDRLPEAKEGWRNHSERCLVLYSDDSYGISHYNYKPPFESAHWVDFAHYEKQPILWQPLPTPPKQ